MSGFKEVKRQRRAGENIIDRVIAYFSPGAGLKRTAARQMLAKSGGYTSGDRSRRANKSWGLSSGSADAEIMPDLENIRSDSRDLMRKAPLALGAVNTVVTNVVGTGLVPQSLPDVETLKKFGKLTDQQIADFTDAAEREFNMWARSTACDVTRAQNFFGMQGLVLRSALESGDVFIRRQMIDKPGRRTQLALQLIEADRIDNPNRRTDTAQLCGGVKRDEFGAPEAYHVLKSHPGNMWVDAKKFETEEIPAFLPNGEWNVLHLMQKVRPEQTRGVPYLAPVVELLKQLVRYSDAELAAAVVSAMFTVFVKTESGEGLPGSSDGSDADDDEVKLGNGAIVDLAPGEDVTFAESQRPAAGFDPFVLAILRQIGVGLELPFEILVKHFTASYSAAQAALLEAWKFFRTRRVWLADSFCTPAYEAVIAEGVARGTIPAPGFLSSPLMRAAYLGVYWNGPPRGSIDQTKDVDANEKMEDRGWKTAQEITAELTGGDWDAKHTRRLKEVEKRKQLPPPAPAAGAKPGTAAPETAPEVDETDMMETE